MNRPLGRVTIALGVLLLALLVNANVLQVVQAKSLRADDRNTRVLVERYNRERGPIVVDGEAVAESVPTTTGPFDYVRRYPGGAVYAPVTGYYSITLGTTGVERTRDTVLSGDDDRLALRRLSDLVTGREVRGGQVSLTLNKAAQEAAVRALGDRRGAVVAIEPSTGRVLALVSTPSYDPGPLSSTDSAVAARANAALSADPAKPLLNRATSETYPPGSTFKIVTAAAALSGDDIDPQTRVPSPQPLVLPGTNGVTLSNFGGETCGDGQTDTVFDAFRISCNTAFASIGLQVGPDRLRAQAEAFGIGQAIDGLGLTQAESSFPDQLNQPQLAQSAIGQYDVRLTPLQVCLISSAIANGGVQMRPYLVDQVLGPDLSVLSTTKPEVLRRSVSPQVATQVTQMMQAVVADGTGTAAQLPGVAVAGKTGTAEHAPNEPPHAWFTGFAPADNPRVAVAVLVEDGGNSGSETTGGKVAAPIARDVMAAVLSGTAG